LGRRISRLKALRVPAPSASGLRRRGAFITSDLFDRTENLQQLTDPCDSTDNTVGFVPVSVNLETTPLPGFDIRHGWVQFRWLFIANNTGTATPTSTQIGGSSMTWRSTTNTTEVADTTACGLRAGRGAVVRRGDRRDAALRNGDIIDPSFQSP
jgi:hypothetical protein